MARETIMQAGVDWTNRVVLVTGGTKGIGRGIAAAFLGLGAHVMICARSAPDRILAVGDASATFEQADVRKPEDVDRVVDACLARYGRLDVLINNAGGSPAVDTATVSPRFSSAIVDLNLSAPLYVSQKANRVMQAQKSGGVILQIASVSGNRASPRTAAYGAAKAGLINLTKTLAVEWAPKVRVNAVTAGLIGTENAEAHYGDAQRQARVAATIPLGRLGTAEDIAEACLFLASTKASYITGAQLVVDGGGERPAYLNALEESPS
jgi:NAD(P)-dependent dehydrogenase (short-subunit alcohol dehydrogenase family)